MRRSCRSPTSSRRSGRCTGRRRPTCSSTSRLPEGRALADAAVDDAAAAVAGLEHAIVVGSHYLEEARRLVAAMPGARLGYDPMRAASRDPGLARDPERLFRHMERRREGVALAYLRFDVVVASEAQGFPLVGRLLDLGIETDAWTVNPGPGLTDAILRTLVKRRCARSRRTLRSRSRAASRRSNAPPLVSFSCQARRAWRAWRWTGARSPLGVLVTAVQRVTVSKRLNRQDSADAGQLQIIELASSLVRCPPRWKVRFPPGCPRACPGCARR